jgi:hypothetical protein
MESDKIINQSKVCLKSFVNSSEISFPNPMVTKLIL